MTAQIPDRVLIDGADWVLLSTPLDPLLRDLDDRVPVFVSPHTANWRGYIAHWQIADGWLFLESIEATVRGPDGSLVTVDHAVALDGLHLPMLADWVSGQLRVGSGRVLRHVHGDFESRWEGEMLIDVAAGRVTALHHSAEAGALGSAGPYRLEESLFGDALSGGGFGQVLLATDLDGRSLVAKAARPRGGGGGTEMWSETPEGRRPLHVPAQAFRQDTGGGFEMEIVVGETLQAILRNEAELLERDAGHLLPLSYGLWPLDPGGMPILVMERLEGRRPSSPEDVLDILRSLQEAVERGTFDAHGDVKLEHVFIGEAGVRMCDPAPRFDEPGRRGFTPLYNPRGFSGPAADVAACATILRYLPDGGTAGWQWCASVLDSTSVPEWASHHERALAVLAVELDHPKSPPAGWVVPPLPEWGRTHEQLPEPTGDHRRSSDPSEVDSPARATLPVDSPTIEPPIPSPSPSPIRRPSAPPPPPPPPPPLIPPAARAFGRDEALEQLDVLRRQSPRTRSLPDPSWLYGFMHELSDVLDVLHPQSAAARNARATAEGPHDPDRWYQAGWALFDVGLAAFAVAPLAQANGLRPEHPPTVDELALALEAVGRPDEAARLYRDSPAVLLASESSRALYSHYAAMDGDLDVVRSMLPQIDGSGPLGFFRERAIDRLSRHKALRLTASHLCPLDDDDLRGWEFLLHGMLLLSSSTVGPDEMRGRYAALWDSRDNIACVLDLLRRSLAALDRRVSHVAAGPDRNSQVIGRAIADRLGLSPPIDVCAEAPSNATRLVVLFDWSVDGAFHDQFQQDGDAILFAYGMDWTRGHSITPDIVGLEAQALYPAWSSQVRIEGDPFDLRHPDPAQRARVVNVPADDRPIDQIASALALVQPAADDAIDSRSAIQSLIEASRTIPHCVGALGGRRARFFPGGPVASARFTDPGL